MCVCKQFKLTNLCYGQSVVPRDRNLSKAVRAVTAHFEFPPIVEDVFANVDFLIILISRCLCRSNRGRCRGVVVLAWV